MARADGSINSSVQVSTPRWLADYSDPDLAVAHFPAKIDPLQFTDKDAMTFTVSGSAIATATSFSIVAAPSFPSGAPVYIPKGSSLYFGGQKIATLSADYTGGTTINCLALPTALAGGEVAIYLPFGTRVQVQGGTLVGRTYTERSANTPFGPAALTDDEVYLLLHDVIDARQNNNVELLRAGRTIKENYLPNYSTVLSVATNETHAYTIGGTLSAGKMGLSSPDTGVATEIAFNANLAAIQTAFDTMFGATNTVVAGTIASFTVAYQNAYANKVVRLVTMDPDGLTGFTSSTRTETKMGGYGTGILALIRKLYVCIVGVN